MPVVQRFEQQVATQALPGARRQATENADSAGVNLAESQARTAQAVSNFGGTVAQVGIQATREQRAAADLERERADQVAVLNAENQLAGWENQRLYDPEVGALGVKGKDSFGLPEMVGSEYQAHASKIEDTLSTDKQRLAFERVKLQRGANLDLTLRRHVYGEMASYEAGELQAYVENAKSAAISNATDPTRIGIELTNGVTAIKTHAKNIHMGPEQEAAAIDHFTSSAHVGVVEQLLALEKPTAAKIYFEEQKGQIKGEALAHLEKALEEGSTRKDGQTQADAILAAGGSLTEQRAKARAITDPKVRDDVMARLEHEDTINERAAREAEATTLRAAYNIIDQTHSVTKIPPAVWANMDGGARSAARSYADRLAKGVAVETDFPTYYGLMQKAGSDPTAFATENLLKYRAVIGDTELKQLTEMQVAIVKGDRKKAEEMGGGFRTRDQILKDTLVRYGIDPLAKMGTTDASAVAQLRRMLDLRVEAVQKPDSSGKPKKATNQEVQDELDHLLSQSNKVEGSFWNLFNWTPNHPVFSSGGRLIDVKIDDITPAEKADLTRALQDRHKPVTDATLLNLYIEMKVK